MILALLTPAAHAFCGTYVGPLGSTLTNDVATVVLARTGSTTTLTLANNVAGDAGDFALVIPVPEVLSAEDVKVVDQAVFSELDAYSAPRVVSYTCEDFYWDDESADTASSSSGGGESADGVVVEAEFQVGEYEIVVLSASGGGGLVNWLDDNGFSVSDEAAPVLDEYIAAGQYFVAAKVHLELFPDGAFLSPLQFTYTSEMWTLPIRIGTTVSGGEQEVVIYALTDESGGATGISNFDEVSIEDECLFPEGTMDYEGFFQAQLDTAFAADGLWLTEYAWPASGCDPCSSEPPTTETLTSLGVTWSDVYLTRIRARYTPEEATQDLVLYQSGEWTTEQIRYIEYVYELESLFPVCGEGMVDDPGVCPESLYDTGEMGLGDDKDGGSCGCAATPTWGLWPLLLGSLAVRRRR